MDCKYFGKCGSCTNYSRGYLGELEEKVERERRRFTDIYKREIDVFPSIHQHYRARAEFKIWHEDGEIFYGMRGLDGKSVVKVDSCPMVVESIFNLMPKLLLSISKSELLSQKLFSIEFLSSTLGDLIVTLIYHKRLSSEWEVEANLIKDQFGISIIGRSRKEKRVIGSEAVKEELKVDGERYIFKNLENSFSQPNPSVNREMVGWIDRNIEKIWNRGDFLELYCGSGNFTIPLSKRFSKVLATEVSKSGIATALENRDRNGILNLEFARVSSEEFVEAMDGVRPFNRLKHIDLKSYKFSTVFVDPPRAGVDRETLKLLQRFENILYISCNPETLQRDIEILGESHIVKKMAIFDQFPYTRHLEMGAILQKRESC
jgi:tRNA (uracil-5-)-methyltransferase